MKTPSLDLQAWIAGLITLLGALFTIISLRLDNYKKEKLIMIESNRYKMITEFNVPVEMRDGTILRANIYRPEKNGEWPVLLSRLPYGKDTFAQPFLIQVPKAVQEGYVVIIQDTRGRFVSEGNWDPIPSFNQEVSDGYDTLEWISNLPYNSGRVGMFGLSYYAFTQWASALSSHSKTLQAIAPAFSWNDPYDGLMYRGGALELGLLTYWQMGMYLDTLPRHYSDQQELSKAMERLISDIDQLPRQIQSLPLKNYAPFTRTKVATSLIEVIKRGYMDHKFVDSLNLTNKLERLELPSLNIAGWYDIFLQGTLDNFVQMRNHRKSPKARNSQLIIGPWRHLDHGHHAGEVNFGLQANSTSIDLSEMQLRWFDHFLKKQDTGMLQEAPIQLFVMGENIWRDEYEWPLQRTEYIDFYLHSQGQANTLQGNGMLSLQPPEQEAPDHFIYDPLNPVPTMGGSHLMLPDFMDGPVDQREIESRDDVLVYTSSVLEEDVEVTGPVKVKLWAISSALDTDFVARLVDVFPDGTAINLTDGIIRTRFRDVNNGEEPSLLEPGKAYLYEIDLWSTSNLFKKGHRIRLDITSSSFPRWDRNPNTGHDFGVDGESDVIVAQQTILHDKEHSSSIVLPIIPRR
ncbi:CocE/NonD family hydrolase [Shimazuella alba]|uniref:CocE/NonD family hydrolase n=1 Tax=Shimazuella alba TaxID=2690964 RepID=A0A6I4VVN6_9BACL|nr:CocE/NonD family hydrolase [Shimazuella alba]MXQ55013.1 CocE/NonD family hydrolase [Shimazuella alba]